MEAFIMRKEEVGRDTYINLQLLVSYLQVVEHSVFSQVIKHDHVVHPNGGACTRLEHSL